jgi:hypothetical protein
MTERELAKLCKVRSGELRIVHAQRARTLRKKGVRVWFDPDLRVMVWERKAT